MYSINKNVIDVISLTRKRIKDNTNIEEIVKFIPRRYIDFTHPQGAYKSNADKEVCMSLHLNGYKEGKTNKRTTYFVGYCIDNITNRKVNVMWFGQAYMRPILYHMSGHNIHVCGTLCYNEQFHSFSLNNPKITTEVKEEALTILPVYSGVTAKDFEAFRTVLKSAMSKYQFNEWIPKEIISECNLMTLKEAYNEVHFPTNVKRLQRALKTLDFEKLLKFSISLARQDVNNNSITNIVPKDYKIAQEIAKILPFELTNDQKNTINNILSNIKSGRCETALIQGDVGSGKTIVAIILMAIFAASGYQSVLIAPTSVLAEQHFNEVDNICSKFGFNVALLTSSLKSKNKKSIINDIQSGNIDIIVGTHSVLNDIIEYNNLGLVVTDEEHKFGVTQREKLKNKTQVVSPIHTISMSATPIPRTLATTMYGNSVSVYTIEQKPLGRLPILTKIENDYILAFEKMYSEIKQGHQCYMVCPKIDTNEQRTEVYSVKQIEKELCIYFNKKDPNIKIASLTGKTKAEDKSKILDDFTNNKIHILVSTTVIEVGVNVPNATTIAISNAEQFGLASLHQLRGRVGRSNLQSYCILISDKSDNQRLNALVSSNDGFEIAKQDLLQRGCGDLAGVNQSGFTEEIAIMLNSPKMFEYTQKYADKIVNHG